MPEKIWAMRTVDEWGPIIASYRWNEIGDVPATRPELQYFEYTRSDVVEDNIKTLMQMQQQCDFWKNYSDSIEINNKQLRADNEKLKEQAIFDRDEITEGDRIEAFLQRKLEQKQDENEKLRKEISDAHAYLSSIKKELE